MDKPAFQQLQAQLVKRPPVESLRTTGGCTLEIHRQVLKGRLRGQRADASTGHADGIPLFQIKGRWRLETVQDMRSSSSNPVSCPETSIKIYGSKEEIQARKSPETVDAPGFAPDASIPVILYGADDQIRTDYLVLTKDALYLLSYISELAGAEGFEPSARGFGDHCSTN